MSKIRYSLRQFLPALALVLTSGCATGGLFTGDSLFSRDADRKVKHATAENPVVRTLGLWQSAEGPGVDGTYSRGFAGQVFFFTSDHAEPVAVEGDVRIYVFDDQGTREEQVKPIHQFDFKSGAWGTHMRKAQWGPGYQIFIPYTRPGSHEARCAIRMRLTPKEGPVIESEMVYVVLKGFTPEEQARLEAGRLGKSTQGPPQTVAEAADAIRETAGEEGLRRIAFDTIGTQTPDGRYRAVVEKRAPSEFQHESLANAPGEGYSAEPPIWDGPKYMRRLPATRSDEALPRSATSLHTAEQTPDGRSSASHVSDVHPLQSSRHPLADVASDHVRQTASPQEEQEVYHDDAFDRHVQQITYEERASANQGRHAQLPAHQTTRRPISLSGTPQQDSAPAVQPTDVTRRQANVPQRPIGEFYEDQ